MYFNSPVYTFLNVSHINRKKICDPLLLDIDIHIIREKYMQRTKNTDHECKYCNEKFKNKNILYKHKQKCDKNIDLKIKLLENEKQNR